MCGNCGLNFKDSGTMVSKFVMIAGKCPACFIKLWDENNNPINRAVS